MITTFKFRVTPNASLNRARRFLVSLFVGPKGQTLQNAGVLTLKPEECAQLVSLIETGKAEGAEVEYEGNRAGVIA